MEVFLIKGKLDWYSCPFNSSAEDFKSPSTAVDLHINKNNQGSGFFLSNSLIVLMHLSTGPFDW